MTRTFVEQHASGLHEVVRAGELASFTFVEHEKIEMWQDIMEPLIGDADPEIHRVGDDKWFFLWRFSLLHLPEHFQLVVRRHVRKHDDAGRADFLGDADLPIFQDIEADAVGGALVHVGVIFARPGERFVL